MLRGEPTEPVYLKLILTALDTAILLGSMRSAFFESLSPCHPRHSKIRQLRYKTYKKSPPLPVAAVTKLFWLFHR